MPTLEFKGKHIVYAHHLSVPYRLLDVDRKKSLLPKESDGKDGNLIIHGDNLHALKALLPRYGGKVNCVYIDPPYNTGNEGWCYNDNVNSELMRRWLKDHREVDRVVDREDEERHDKWLCMMWPRLQLLHELLAGDGLIFVSIDDNEAHRLRAIMDDIFGDHNFVAQIVAQTNPRGRSLRHDIAQTHEYILVYAKNAEEYEILKIAKSEASIAEYDKKDSGGEYRLLRLRNTGIQHFNRQTRPNLFFPIYVDPETGQTALSRSERFSIEVFPINGDKIEGCWTWSRDKIQQTPDLIVGEKKRSAEWRIYRKDYLRGESLLTKAKSIWLDKGINHEIGKETLTEIIPELPFSHSPKSPALVSGLIRLACKKDGLVLDSFAGSGTTAQAVLELNKEDGGDRKFILVECEDYADSLTAERVRRVIKGVKNAKSETMKNGFGGHFAFCSLGKAIELEALLRGQVLPSYEQMARYAAYVATGAVIDKIKAEPGRDYFFGAHGGYRFHLIYRPDKAFLRGRDSALRFDVAEAISAAARKAGKTALVFAPWKFMSQKDLSAIKVVFCQIPHEVLRLADDADSE